MALPPDEADEAMRRMTEYMQQARDGLVEITGILVVMLSVLTCIREVRQCARHRLPGMTFREAQPAHSADDRSIALLKQWLLPEQLAQYERNGCFEVTGSHSGKRYRITSRHAYNVYRVDGWLSWFFVTADRYCFVPEGTLPIGDVMLAQKIALETDERAALAVATRLQTR